MAYMFPSQTGVPAVIADPSASSGTFTASMAGWAGSNSTHCLITGVSLSTQGNYQFLLTLRNYTYVYVFGERMGDFTVSGVSLAGLCGSTTDGMPSAIDYYVSHAISNTGTPIAVSIGGWAMYAFLIGATFSHQDAKNRLGQFAYVFKTVADPK